MLKEAQVDMAPFDLAEAEEIPEIEKAKQIIEEVLRKEEAEDCPPEEIEPLKSAISNLEDFISVESIDQEMDMEEDLPPLESTSAWAKYMAKSAQLDIDSIPILSDEKVLDIEDELDAEIFPEDLDEEIADNLDENLDMDEGLIEDDVDYIDLDQEDDFEDEEELDLDFEEIDSEDDLDLM